MEEKVLIESCSCKTTKKVCISIIIALLFCSIICIVFWIRYSIESGAFSNAYFTSRYTGIDYMECRLCKGYEIVPENEMTSHFLQVHGVSKLFSMCVSDGLGWAIVHWTLLLLSGIFCLIYFLMSRCKIIVTDKNISGKTFWGKKVVLPIHMISAYSTSKIFSVLTITSSSGLIKFPCIGNIDEITNILQQLLNERQNKTETHNDLILQHNNSNNLDDLAKLKNLFDIGVITQEEFDAKKKEILGL